METYGDEKPHEFRWYHPSSWEQQISLEISWVIMGPLQIAVWSTPLLNKHEQTRTAAIITQKWWYSSISTERERGIYIYNIHTLCIYIYLYVCSPHTRTYIPTYNIYIYAHTHIYICNTGYIPTTHQPFQSHEPGVPGVPGPFHGPTFGGIVTVAEEIQELPRTAPEKTGSRGDESCVNHGEIGWIWMDSWYILWILGL